MTVFRIFSGPDFSTTSFLARVMDWCLVSERTLLLKLKGHTSFALLTALSGIVTVVLIFFCLCRRGYPHRTLMSSEMT